MSLRLGRAFCRGRSEGPSLTRWGGVGSTAVHLPAAQPNPATDGAIIAAKDNIYSPGPNRFVVSIRQSDKHARHRATGGTAAERRIVVWSNVAVTHREDGFGNALFGSVSFVGRGGSSWTNNRFDADHQPHASSTHRSDDRRSGQSFRRCNSSWR